MSFGTSIHCMDGRIQETIIAYLKETYNLDYIDAITEPGPCKIVADNTNDILVKTIDDRVSISVNKHGSKIIALSGHHDCAGNPISKELQIQQVEKGVENLKKKYPDVKFVKLWIDENWVTSEF